MTLGHPKNTLPRSLFKGKERESVFFSANSVPGTRIRHFCDVFLPTPFYRRLNQQTSLVCKMLTFVQNGINLHVLLYLVVLCMHKISLGGDQEVDSVLRPGKGGGLPGLSWEVVFFFFCKSL